MVGRGVPAEPFDEERLTRRVRPTCENVIAFDGNIIIFLIHFQTGENRPFLTGRDRDLKDRILDIIVRLTSAKNVIDIRYDPKLLSIIESRSAESVSALLRNFRRMATESNNDVLLKEAKKAEKQLKALKAARNEAETERDAAEADARKAQAEAIAAAEEAEQVRRDAEEAHKEIRQRTTQNLFLKSIVSLDMGHVLHLHHHISISAHTIEQCALNVARKLNNDKPLSKDYLLTFINRIVRQVKTISTITRFATKAQFNVEAVTVTEDLVAFIREYIGNVCAGLYTTTQEKPLEFQIKAAPKLTHVTEFKPIEITMILDNLIANAVKHGARTVEIEMKAGDSDGLTIAVRNDGAPILKKDAERIFEMGYSTTEGSGLGLTHVRESLSEMGGTIHLNTAFGAGVEFVILMGTSK
ncbi:MAG: ATP-binding protein [Kiritimatiellia bacterium]|jgi:signal transduction histidine kinase